MSETNVVQNSSSENSNPNQSSKNASTNPTSASRESSYKTEHVLPGSRSTHGNDLTKSENAPAQRKNFQSETSSHLNSPKGTSDGSELSDTMSYPQNKK